MTTAFKVGDRVRLKQQGSLQRRLPAGVGTIVDILMSPTAPGEVVYHVRMDDEPREWFACFFSTDQLESAEDSPGELDLRVESLPAT